MSSNNKWSTCILPFDYTPASGTFKAYECKSTDSSNSNLVLTSVDEMKAYTPYILYSENGFSGTVSGTVDASKYPSDGIVTNGYIVGAIEKQTVTGTSNYVLQNHSGTIQFYTCGTNNITVPAGKCYVSLSSSAKGFGFSIEDSATGISELHSEAALQNDSEAAYNLAGQRVAANAKGIVVKNGKKILQ